MVLQNYKIYYVLFNLVLLYNHTIFTKYKMLIDIN